MAENGILFPRVTRLAFLILKMVGQNVGTKPNVCEVKLGEVAILSKTVIFGSKIGLIQHKGLSAEGKCWPFCKN